jgi:hypothetical protein
MKSVCPKCKKKEKLFPCHVLPQQWYNGTGRIIYLCKFCLDSLNKDYPLHEVLYVSECEHRINDFLQKKFLS